MIRFWPAAAVWFAIGLCCLGPVSADPPPVVSPATAAKAIVLTLEPSEGTIQYGDTRGGYDAGQIDPLNDTPVKHVFMLKNLNHVALIIDRLDTSCYCLDASINGRELPISVPPRTEVAVTVALDPSLFSMARRHDVSVFVRGQALPAASLEMLAKPRPLIAFSSTFLDFGEVKAGSRKTLPLTVTLVPGFSRRVDSINLLVLKSSSPDIRIERVSITPLPLSLELTPAGEVIHHSGEEHPDANMPTVITYRLTLAPGKTVGGIDGKVSLVDPRSPHLLVTQGASIPVVGHVIGEISASPGAVDFGLGRAGRPATRRIAISGTSLTILRGLQIGALPPYLSAHWLEPAPPATATAASDKTRQLEVLLTSNAPAGVSTTQVTVTARDGQMLRIPVMLNVLSNPKGQE